jgi:hypothetical protein
MTKAEIVFEKEAKLWKKILPIGASIGSSVFSPNAEGQLGWLAKQTMGPLVRTLSGDRAIPKLDTSALRIAPISWVSETHPHFKALAKEMREAMGDTNLAFKGFRIDSGQVGKRRFINIFGTDKNDNITHRLFRNEAVPGPKGNPNLVDREQWADEISHDAATNFLKQRESVSPLKRKTSLANR